MTTFTPPEDQIGGPRANRTQNCADPEVSWVMVEAWKQEREAQGLWGTCAATFGKLDYEQHYGFIVDEAKRDWVFHRSALVGPSRFDDLMVGDTVELSRWKWSAAPERRRWSSSGDRVSAPHAAALEFDSCLNT